MAKYDTGNALSGALSGAASGSAIGSAFPLVGNAIGGALGGILGFAGGLFGSKKKKKKNPKQVGTLDPQQQALYQDYIASLRGDGPFNDLYNFDSDGYNDVFDQTVGRPAYRNFQENIIPGITGQFRQGNIMNSSYAGDALSRAGRDVQENLDAQRASNIFQGQQQAQGNKQNAINQLLNMQTFAYGKPSEKQPNSVDQILNGLAPIAGDWFADYLSGMNKKKSNPPSGVPNTTAPI